MQKRALSVMVQGTSSSVGKSVLTAALCRIFRERGFRVAPFKSQNMALNSAVASDGGEIGRAQAFQAMAAGVEPTSDMNPVLLKPTADSVSQVIIQGRVHGSMSAREFHSFKPRARGFVAESFERISKEYDVVVIEGAGSPAEVNLREGDIANMGMAEIAGCPVLLVGDIDRGGVFASLVGTLALITEEEAARIRGFVINRFRGDRSLLEPGIEMLTQRTGVPTLGVVPYLRDLRLPEEDGVALDGPGGAKGAGNGAVSIKVIRLPRISNFTDFDALRCEPGVEVDFVDEPGGLKGAAMVIIPGSKNTIEDLCWLRERGFAGPLAGLSASGVMIAGICGGFQMLGSVIRDPGGVESGLKMARGLALLDAATTLSPHKLTFRAEAELRAPASGRPQKVSGYEIHMGETRTSERPFSTILARNGERAEVADGACSLEGLVWGTYLHGIFDNDLFRASLLERLGRAASKGGAGVSYAEEIERSFASLARTVEESVDIPEILKIMGAAEGTPA